MEGGLDQDFTISRNAMGMDGEEQHATNTFDNASQKGGEEGNCQTPNKAQRTFRRRVRDSILSPGSLRANKLNKSRDEELYERMHIMLRSEISFMRAEMEKDMQATLEEYKQAMYTTMKKEFDKEIITMRTELHKEIKGALQNWIRMETTVLKTVIDKKIDDTHSDMQNWKKENDIQSEEKTKVIKDLEGKIAALTKDVETKETTQGKTADPQLQEEMQALKSNLESGMKSWTEVVKQHEDNTKWIEGAKKEKNAEQTPPSTIINLTLEEEEKRRRRALHVRVTGLKDTDNVEEEVAGLLNQMNVTETTHTGAWRVGKKGTDKEGKPRDRALILRFPTQEARKEFLKKRPALKKTGIFLGDDLTLAQVAHMQEKMPEIRAAREQGKIAFYRGGKVVILEGKSS